MLVLHPEVDVAEAAQRVVVPELVVGAHELVGRDRRLYVEVGGQAILQRWAGDEVGVGGHAALALERAVEQLALVLEVAGIDGAGPARLGGAVGAQRRQARRGGGACVSS